MMWKEKKVSKLFVVYTFFIFKAVGMKSVVYWFFSKRNDEIWSKNDREIVKRRWKMLKREAEKKPNFNPSLASPYWTESPIYYDTTPPIHVYGDIVCKIHSLSLNLSGLDVRWVIGNRDMQSCRSRVPKADTLHIPRRNSHDHSSQCRQNSWGLDG